MNIYPVEKRAGYAVPATLYLERRATAFMLRIAKVAAGTRIHCSHEHKPAGECYAGNSSCNSDKPILKRLAQDLKHIAMKFRQFVEKQYTPVCKAYFTWHRVSSAAEQTCIRDSVMW